MGRWLVWVALCSMACGTEPLPPLAQVLVHLDAEPGTAAQARVLRVRVFGAASDGVFGPTPSYERTVGIGADDASFPATVPVVPVQGDASRRMRLVAEILTSEGVVLSTQRVETAFVADEVREVGACFEDECREVVCPSGESCRDGECVPAEVVALPVGEQIHGCVVEACRGQTDGTACGLGGQCRDERCCTGCWQGDICHPGRGSLSCGVGGDTCVACGCPTACIDGSCGVSGGFDSLAVGDHHTCVLRSGEAFCWGANEAGQLGLGDTGDRSTPSRVPGVPLFSEIAAGGAHTCGLDLDGRIHCWGANGAGQLGDGTKLSRADAALVVGAQQYQSVIAGGSHTCARRVNGVLGVTGFLDCWGADNRGQIGDGNDDGRSDQVTPIAVRAGADYAMVSAGEWHTCGVKAGQVYCWGGNNNFQTGIPGAARYDVPTDVMLGGISVAAGYTHTCAIASLGAMRCWGQNAEGQLGDGTRTARTMPTATAVVTTNDWAAVSAGTQHTCAIHTDGSLWCWGSNASGQLGLGEIDASTVAVEVGGLAGTMIQIVEAGAEHTCVLDAARTLYCFGSNARGQLGRDESGGSVTTPEPLCFE